MSRQDWKALFELAFLALVVLALVAYFCAQDKADGRDGFWGSAETPRLSRGTVQA
jgi:hypothetical protein